MGMVEIEGGSGDGRGTMKLIEISCGNIANMAKGYQVKEENSRNLEHNENKSKKAMTSPGWV